MGVVGMYIDKIDGDAGWLTGCGWLAGWLANQLVSSWPANQPLGWPTSQPLGWPTCQRATGWPMCQRADVLACQPATCWPNRQIAKNETRTTHSPCQASIHFMYTQQPCCSLDSQGCPALGERCSNQSVVWLALVCLILMHQVEALRPHALRFGREEILLHSAYGWSKW